MNFICSTALDIGTHNNFKLIFKRFRQSLKLKFYAQIFHRLDNLKRGKNAFLLLDLLGAVLEFQREPLKDGELEM